MEKLKNFRLRSKEDRRFKQGHPWVYSNELQDSPKGIEPGELLELHDASGNFLAYGFGNPNSLIAFRALSRQKVDGDQPKAKILSPEFFAAVIERAFAFRLSFFSKDQSFRLVYGEADGLPGLIIDRFHGHTEGSKGEKSSVYVIQPHAFGMDRNLDVITKALAMVSKKQGEAQSIVVLRRDAGSREREGLAKEETVVKNLQSGQVIESTDPYREFWFSVPGLMGSEVKLKTDLVSGQKTGFFFDQLQNVKLTQSLLLRKLRLDREYVGDVRLTGGRPFRVLDLCSYIGQWSVHLTQTFIERECLPLEVTLVDASDSALKLAEQNVVHEAKHYFSEKKIGVRRLKADVLEPMPSLPDQGYDVVIADPPAFIKNRKSIPQGKAAYVNLFSTAIQKAAKGGLVVFCSCSQLLSAEDMVECLSKAARRSGRRVRFIAQGSPSVDHFMQFEFTEGHYLKSWIAQVDEA
jgi:23S rRNA (cytosine1962-C5)-methyltransferase